MVLSMTRMLFIINRCQGRGVLDEVRPEQNLHNDIQSSLCYEEMCESLQIGINRTLLPQNVSYVTSIC